MDFKDDLPSAVAEARQAVSPFRDTSLVMSMVVSFSWMLNYLPISVVAAIIPELDKRKTLPVKRSLAVSNMNGPSEHKWKFKGKTAHWITMTTCAVVPEVTLNSMFDTCKVTLSGDAS